jgi:hypothetical protein
MVIPPGDGGFAQTLAGRNMDSSGKWKDNERVDSKKGGDPELKHFLGGAFFVMVCLSGHAGEFDGLLIDVETAYGGPAAVARLRSYRVEGETSSLMRGAVGKVTREYRAPDRLRVEIAYPDRTEVRVVTREGVWRGDASGVREVEGPMREAVLFQLLRSDLPGMLLRFRDRLEDGGVMQHENNAHRLVVLPWSQSLTMRFSVHAESSRITLAEGVIETGGRRLVFATSFSDFRRVGGVLFPFAEQNFANGRHVASTRIDRLVLQETGVEVSLPSSRIAIDTEELIAHSIGGGGKITSGGR